MANEYATRSELEEYLLGAGKTQAAQEPNFDLALEGASRAIDRYCNRFFYKHGGGTPSARTYTVDGDAYKLRVDDIYTTTGLVVKTDEDFDGVYETTWVLNDLVGAGFYLAPDRLPEGWPWERIDATGVPFPVWRRAIQVTASWGWATVPVDVKQATVILASQLWKRKDAVLGIGGAADTGFFELRRKMDPHVGRLIDPYRRFY